MNESNASTELYRVLVIDDDERLVALARLALTKDGIEVESAATGADGLALLETAPDLVILDVVLPEMSGRETPHLGR